MTESTRQFVGAIALVRRDSAGGGNEWLALWNSGRACFHFIEAHRLDGETFRQSLIREVAWTTGLVVGKDFLAAGGARARLQFTEAAGHDDIAAEFTVEFYLVELMGDRHREILNRLDGAHWVSSRQLQTGIVEGGRPLCPRLVRLLKEADLFRPWET